MEEMLYNALDLAAFIRSMDLSCKAQAKFLECVWAQEYAFLPNIYRLNKRRMVQDVLYWLSYFSDKTALDAELPLIKRDAELTGCSFSIEDHSSEYADLNWFFKNARLRILFGDGKDYVQIKRRVLMKRYGYKKMSPALASYLHQCIFFYHLQPYTRGNIRCKIEEVDIDAVLIFRVI